MDVSPTIQHPHGRIRSITGTDPAADTEILEAVSPRRRWRLLSLNFSLVTDANVADRYVYLYIKDPTNLLVALAPVNTQAADLTYTYYFTNLPAAEIKIVTNIYRPLPPLTLPAGYTIGTITSSRQAGDNYSAPQLLVEEWIDP